MNVGDKIIVSATIGVDELTVPRNRTDKKNIESERFCRILLEKVFDQTLLQTLNRAKEMYRTRYFKQWDIH